jgi:hypothetical protein
VRGEPPSPIFWSGAYKVEVHDKLDNLIYTVDNFNTDPANLWNIFTQLAASDGAEKLGFDYLRQAVAGTIGWGVQTAKRGVNVLRYIPVAMWPAILAGTSNDDHTAYLQAAYNAASNSMEREVYHPAGKYNFTRLYCYYDAALNPGYNIDRDGEISLTGDGTSSENGGACGTILMCTSANGEGLTVSPGAEDAVPYRSRDFQAHGISFQGSTTGFLVLARGVPGLHISNCEFIQNNAAGGGLWATTAYFGLIEKSRFQNRAAGAKTGDAIKFGTTIVAGLLTLRDLNVSGYGSGLNMYAGGWQLLSIEDSELAGSSYGIYVNGEVQVLNLFGCYFEGACTSFVTDTAANRIKNLNMVGCWAYGAGLTGPAIALNAPNSVQIIGGYSQDQNTTWLNIVATPNGGTSAYAINGFSFPRTVAAPAPLTLFTGVVPELHGIDYATGDANVLLAPAAARPVVSRASYAGSSYQGAGHMLDTSMKAYGAVNGGSVDIQADGFPSWVSAYCVTNPTTVYLPAIGSGIPHGFDCTVTADSKIHD